MPCYACPADSTPLMIEDRNSTMSILGRFFRNGAKRAEFEIPSGVLVYAIGDIHGRVDLLEKLLRAIKADRAGLSHDVNLVFLGDYIDRGDGSRAVIDTLTELESDEQLKSTFLMGNHEDAMLRFLAEPEENANWLSFGGLATLLSYGVKMSRSPDSREGLRECADALEAGLPPSHRAFLQALRLSIQIGDYFFCHAGVSARFGPDAQPIRTLLWGEGASSLDQPWNCGLCVVHGHYAQAAIDINTHRIGIDTGAYFSGRLTALRLETTKVRILQT